MTARLTSKLACPKCEEPLAATPGDQGELRCAGCATRYATLLDPARGLGALVDLDEAERAHPLWLPRGSIRALITLSVAGLAWTQVFQQREIPHFLLGLLLTLIGYYFGVRRELRGNDSGVYDIAGDPERPLFLPAGSIRLVLMLGFLGAAGYLAVRGNLLERVYLEFFLILAGLIMGHLFRRMIARMDGALARDIVKHGKAVAVILVTGALIYLVQAGLHDALYPLPLVLGGLVSFYFGSRS
jgi:hypothetical protein